MQIHIKNAEKRRVYMEYCTENPAGRNSKVLRVGNSGTYRRWSWSCVAEVISLGYDVFTRYRDRLC
jgi:hypothetical protein